MRLFLSILITALIIPLAAYAQAPKPVEVINDPLAVEVTTPIAIVEPVVVEITEPLEVEVVNPAPAPPPLRWQLVGFTTTEFEDFSAVAGVPSLFDMIAACQAEVDPSSRMCRVDDIQLTTVIPSGLPTVDGNGNRIRAWLNPDPANVGVIPSSTLNCNDWSTTAYSGITVVATGQIVNVNCSSNHPVACCALVP